MGRAVIARGSVAEAGEDPAEIGGIRHADGMGNLFHRSLTGEEEILCPLNPPPQEIVQRADADDAFELI